MPKFYAVYSMLYASKIIVNPLAQKLLYECWRTCKCSSLQLLFHPTYLHSTSLFTLRFKYAIFLYSLWSMLYSLRSCIDLVAQKLLLQSVSLIQSGLIYIWWFGSQVLSQCSLLPPQRTLKMRVNSKGINIDSKIII